MDRLDEVTKNIQSFGEIKIFEYKNEIQKVTGDDINNVIKEFLARNNPTVVLCGPNANQTISDSSILSALKL